MKTSKELLNVSLPKWPKCVVTGTSITKEQALEIIRRTDCYVDSRWSNDKKFDDKFKKMFNTPDVELDNFDKMKEYHAAQEDFRNQWGYISLNYLCNDYICSSFVQGANGWCHPDGVIDYHFNIGKWPEVEEVSEDLNQLIEAFPFLELEVTLFDDEYCENDTNPLVSFLVREGKVELIDPSERNIHEEFGREEWTYSESETERNMMRVILQGSDHKIPQEVLEEWATKYRYKPSINTEEDS